ncbi:hypothetical protein Igag_0643 [Ignisphaera aggregans DSM 17230]|uniref:Flavodoxin-like domain-containing protein n=1 Tax=Ignisphaera aggregans (strain DSM 17230 / JCM 13409 / AQ1.S1) TaxID=583356 RepID=E0SSS6_IGNAA|nr:hypothetical protein Igag_0643 [Ignisphaera aggregans DSM 17230]
MNICIVYYSKTGKTHRVVEYIKKRLEERGTKVKIFFVAPTKEYFNKFLHLNPRILYEVLAKKTIEITNIVIDQNTCSMLIIATPVWWGSASPPIYTFIEKYSGRYGNPVYCIATADLEIDYASKLKRELDEKRYNVIDCISIVNLDRDMDKLNRFIESIINRFTS